MPVRAETVGRYLVRRVGFRRAVRTLGFIYAWAMWIDVHGEAPTPTILAGPSARSRASYYNDLAVFREAFASEGWEWPDEPARLLLAEIRRRRITKHAQDLVLVDVLSWPATVLGVAA